MTTKILNSPKFRLSTISLFLKDHLSKISQITYNSPATLQRYMNKLYKLVTGYDEIILDQDGTILTWNNDFQKIEGYTESEIIGQSINLFYLPQHRQSKLAQKLIEEAALKGTATQFGQFVRKDGVTFWGSIKIVAIKMDKEILGFIALSRKLSDSEIE